MQGRLPHFRLKLRQLKHEQIENVMKQSFKQSARLKTKYASERETVQCRVTDVVLGGPRSLLFVPSTRNALLTFGTRETLIDMLWSAT